MYGLILHDDLESFCEQQHFVMAQYAKLNHSLIASYVVFGFFACDLSSGPFSENIMVAS